MKNDLSIILTSSLIFGMMLSGCSGSANMLGTIPQNPTEETAVISESKEAAADNSEKPDTDADKVNKFDLDNRTVVLNNGIEMPILGIGTYMLSNEQAENSVYWALKDGYRLIDTARIYGNETGIGKGIQKAVDEGFVTREEIFVTTKMWTANFDNGGGICRREI